MSVWAAVMLIAGGLFAGGAATFAWSRVPVWRTMPPAAFVDDFSQTISRTDKVQPALLVAAIAASLGFAVAADGPQRLLAIVGTGGFVAVLIGSLAVLVPLQRRIIECPDPEAVGEMRQRWFSGHLGRSSLSVLAFVATALAASSG
ncbi:MAG: DUF1772 domain-containing protein [Actinomycetota bacterium]|nr:DUF1772 domain-containing protein [Actinomycetota bacterium]